MLQQIVHVSILPLTIVSRVHILQRNRLKDHNDKNSDIHYSGEITENNFKKKLNKGGNNNNHHYHYYNSSNDSNNSNSSRGRCRCTER